MSEELEKSGLYIDDIYRLRVQDPRLANETNELREECLEYAEKLQEFHKLSNEFIEIMNNYGKLVEEQKLYAIALQIRLKSVHKHQQTEQQIYQSKIQEKTLILERLKNEYQSLQRIEADQLEMINKFLINDDQEDHHIQNQS